MKFFLINREKSIWSSLIFLSFSLYLLFSFISLTVSQILIFLAFIFLLIFLFKEKQKIAFPSFFWWLIGYALFSLLSCFFSINPKASFIESREFLLFLIVPIVYTGFQRKEDFSIANFALLGSASLSSLYSLFYYLIKGLSGESVAGLVGHPMTQGGLLLLFSCLALSKVVFTRSKMRFLWAAGLLLSAVALGLTLMRSNWVGFVVAVSLILFLYKPKTLIIIPVMTIVVFLLSPQFIKRNVLSIFSLKNKSNRERIEYIKAGIKIIRDFPIFGTGPENSKIVFQNPKYGLSEEAKENVHLHNNLIQIGAERGIPILLIWLTFIGWTFISLARLLRNKDPSLYPLTIASMGVLAGLFTAGLFEYNFSDSEIAMLFFYLITIPFSILRIEKNKNQKVK